MTAQGPCPAPPAAHLGTRPGHVVQPLARLWLPHPRYAVAGHLRAHGDAPALRLHRAPARPIAAGALWQGTERADGCGGQTPRAARSAPPPLDIVFISPDGRVHRIESGAEPFSTSLIPSEGTISAVLELNAGQADKIG